MPDVLPSASDLIMILSMSASTSRSELGPTKRRKERAGRTSSLVRLGPQVGDRVVDLLHLEAVEAHDGTASEYGDQREREEGDGERRWDAPVERLRELLEVLVRHLGRLRHAESVRLEERERTIERGRTLRLMSSRRYRSSMSLYSVTSSSPLCVTSAPSVWISPPRRACCRENVERRVSKRGCGGRGRGWGERKGRTSA